MNNQTMPYLDYVYENGRYEIYHEPEEGEFTIVATTDREIFAKSIVDLCNGFKEQIGEFRDWYDKLSPAEKCTVWPPAGSGSGTGLYNMQTKDIVDKFLSYKKKLATPTEPDTKELTGEMKDEGNYTVGSNGIINGDYKEEA